MPGDCLIVENEPVLAKNMRMFLERAGYTVRAVDRADAALAAIRERRPEVVVLDFELPSFSGVELLARLIEEEPGIRIVMISGREDSDLALEAIRRGAADFLTKPLSLGRLRAILDLLTGTTDANRKAGTGDERRSGLSLIWSSRTPMP